MPRVIAHRGASAAYPENTLEAFEGAAHLGADEVELDVRRSADGALVIHHDAELASGEPILATRSQDLPEGVCLLDDALEVCDRHGLAVNVEIKALPGEPDHDIASEVADQVAGLLAERYGDRPELLAKLLVTSFWPPTLGAVNERAPALRTGLLCFDLANFDTTVESAVAAGHVAINPWEGVLTRDMVTAARRAGLEVNVWTCDDPDRIAELAAWGVDGIITNVPDVARKAIGG